MEKAVVWYSIQNDGDGSASLKWFLKAFDAQQDQEAYDANREDDEDDIYDEPQWADSCYGSVETFIGSDIYKEAVTNDRTGS